MKWKNSLENTLPKSTQEGINDLSSSTAIKYLNT